MGNDALRVNPFSTDGTVPFIANGLVPDIHITTRGSNWYWAVCALMTVATLAFFGMSFGKPRPWRLFHYIIATITLISAIDYFTKASNLGWVGQAVQFRRSDRLVAGIVRQIFYSRYINWFITKPLILLTLFLTAGLPWPTILFSILLQMVAVVCLLIGALVRTSYKWGYFVLALAAIFGVLYHVLLTGRKHAGPLGADISKVYTTGAGLVALTWLLYPICWGLSEGGNVISPDSEAIFYGILDILSQAVFGALMLFGHKNLDPRRMGIHVRDYDDVPAVNRIDKGHHHNGDAVPVTTTSAV